MGSFFGTRVELPAEMTERFPELAEVRVRLGGFPLRIGGWVLGQPHVAGFTLGRTIFVHPDAALEPSLLLHELRHVHQFRAEKSFPVRYLWQSIRRGYLNNPYEVDARRFAKEQLEWSGTQRHP
jgi:hypothetical protein